MSINKYSIVSDVMLNINEFPIIKKNTIFKDALQEMINHKIGIVCIVDDNFKLMRLFTDGDLRRILLSVQKPLSALFMDDILDYSGLNPFTINPETLITNATKLMGERRIWDLPVVDRNEKLIGLFHLHRTLEHMLKDEIIN